MKKMIIIFAAIALGFGITTNALAQKKNTSVPVTTVINDLDPATGFFDIRSDWGADFPYKNGEYSVSSIINSGGDFNLNTKNSDTRRIFFSFEDPVNPGNPQNQPPFLSGYVPAHFQSKCSQYNIYIQNFKLNETKTCDLLISIDYNGTIYSLRASPTGYPETEPVKWTCIGLNSSGKCNAWEMAPSAVHNAERKIAMQLLKPATSGPWVDQKLGLYYMSFNVKVTNP